MKHILFLFAAVLLSCGITKEKYKKDYAEIYDAILQANDIEGTILIYDPSIKSYYSNNFEKARTGYLPASTFKIPNSIIALETGVIDSDTSIFRWDGAKRAFPQWEKDLTFREAFQVSCVPCYQEIARKIGLHNMHSYLDKLKYKNMIVTANTLDNFWLRGDSRISPFEQIIFLERLHDKKLPIQASTYLLMKNIMLIEQNDKYALYGKTGWSDENGINNGWFVGYVEKANSLYYFALNAQPKNHDNVEKFIPGRKKAVLEALNHMNIL